MHACMRCEVVTHACVHELVSYACMHEVRGSDTCSAIGLHEKSRTHILVAPVQRWAKALYGHGFLYAKAEFVITSVEDLIRNLRLCTRVFFAVVVPKRGSVILFPRSARVLTGTIVESSNCHADICGLADIARRFIHDR